MEGVATGPAKADNRGYEFVAPSPQLMNELREARRLNKLPELRQFPDDFGAEEFPNSAVLVNWNGKDPKTSTQAGQLQTVMQDRFRGRIGRKEYHKDPVSSVESIEQAVVEAFGAVQARLIEVGRIRSGRRRRPRPPTPQTCAWSPPILPSRSS